jgi:hypothetical protein
VAGRGGGHPLGVTMAAEIPTHLVLGGSHGIGYAYAEYWAAKGHRLVLVGRGEADLNLAADRLLAVGATSTNTICGDVLNGAFRSDLFSKLDTTPLKTILVGGPSPLAGNCASIVPSDLASSHEICVIYPAQVLHWAQVRVCRHPQRIIIVSSSAAREGACHRHFFLSALYRRVLDELIDCSQRAGSISNSVEVWYPHVVLTRLSGRFAEKLVVQHSSTDPVEALKNYLSVENIPSAREYVWEQIKSIDKP